MAGRYNHNASSICFGSDDGPAPSRTAARSGGQGGSQNTDNTLGDVPSVRLYAPPGGSSSICFGGDAGPAPVQRQAPAQAPMYQQPAPVQQAAPVYQQPAPAAYDPYSGGGGGGGHRTASRGAAQGGSQNTGNTIGDVPSVRLYAPPGGSSSISFGGEPAPAPVQRQAPVQQYQPPPQQYQPAPAAYQPAPAAYQPAPAANTGLGFNDGVGSSNGGRTASRGAAQGGSQNTGNTIGSIPSVKLHAPPGGASSISFG